MPPKPTLCRTVQQYSKYPLPPEDMAKLVQIAQDQCRVRNYVYQRYGGVKSIRKLYESYTVQNEMTALGLGKQLGLPSVYYHSAVNDAAADIKTMWTQLLGVIRENAKNNPNMDAADLHYIRFALKFPSCCADIFNGRKPRIGDARLDEKLALMREGVDCARLDSYIRRQARRHAKSLCTQNASGFSVTERGYRYGENDFRDGEICHGIFLTTKEPRKRVFVELTDKNEYKGRLYVALDSKNGSVTIKAPMYVHVKNHGDYENEVGLSLGIASMITTDAGNEYGEEYGKYHERLVSYIREKGGGNRRERENNPGTRKYEDGKRRLEESLHNYANREINRMLRAEKPCAVYMAKLPMNPAPTGHGGADRFLSMWQRGYVASRVRLKCEENGIRFSWVQGKGIGSECSSCGAADFTLERGAYRCNKCGLEIESRRNAALNALHRGQETEK